MRSFADLPSYVSFQGRVEHWYITYLRRTYQIWHGTCSGQRERVGEHPRPYWNLKRCTNHTMIQVGRRWANSWHVCIVSSDPQTRRWLTVFGLLAHVSASGNDLVALTSSGRVVIIPAFERLFSGSDRPSFEDIVTQLNFRPTSGEWDVSLYLAVGDRNGKLAVATVRSYQSAIFSQLTALSFPSSSPPLSLAQRHIRHIPRSTVQQSHSLTLPPSQRLRLSPIPIRQRSPPIFHLLSPSHTFRDLLQLQTIST
jgi:hypothetical protein